MFAWAEKPAPCTCPASGMQPSPVWTAVRAAESTTATCRNRAEGSTASSACSASGAASPAARRLSSRGP